MSPLSPKKRTNNSSSLASLGESAQPTLRGRALRLLARRDWSRHTLRGKLLEHAADAAALEALDALLEEFAQRGWISDARYAESVVRVRKDRYGKAAIARRLKQAGVPEATTAEALADMDADHEFQTALSLCRRKFREPPTDDKEKARQVRFLQARGYSLGLALQVVKNAFAGANGVTS